jgi:hypothetical protein
MNAYRNAVTEILKQTFLIFSATGTIESIHRTVKAMLSAAFDCCTYIRFHRDGRSCNPVRTDLEKFCDYSANTNTQPTFS